MPRAKRSRLPFTRTYPYASNTEVNAHSEDGAGRKREREAYTAGFDPSEVEGCSSGLKPKNMD